MENLHELVKSLSQSEKKMVRKFLSSYSSNGKSETLSLDLFDILNKRKKVLSNKDCSMILFGKDEKNRIRVLKSRLKNRILDALTTDIVLESQTYDSNTKLSLKLRKKIIQFQLLRLSNKSNQKIKLSLLNDVIEQSNKNELYRVTIDALNYKKAFIGFRSDITTYETIEEEMIKAKQLDETRAYITDCYYKMILLYRTSNPNHTKIRQTLKEYIKKGDQLLFKGNTFIGQYYLNIIKCGYYMEVREYDTAIYVMQNQLKLLSKSKLVYRKTSVGATHDYLAENYINNGDYNKASENADIAQQYFPPNSTNYIVAQQLSFRAKLYGKQLKEAETLIKQILNQYKDDLDSHRISTHQFFLANLYFAKGDFKNCNRLLSQAYEFKQDRTGWEFNLRLLHILCLIEQGKFDEAYTKHFNLTRLLKKYKKTELSSRNKIIVEILKQWLKSTNVTAINSVLIRQLNIENNAWDPMKSELIPFHHWIQTKI